MAASFMANPRRGGLLALAAIVAVLPLILPNNFYVGIAINIGIAAIAVIGLNLLIGYAGQISLGHAGFFGIGAYASGVLPAHFGVDPWLALAAGLAFTGVLAAAIGWPILRLKGHYLAVATLGMGLLISMVLANEAQLTGGPDGMSVQRLELFGWKLRGKDTWYWVVGGALFVATWLSLNVIDSPTGRALRALHDSEVAAQVNGVDVARYKLYAFVISAMFAALAGSFSALYNGFITPSMADFLQSIWFVTMVVVGGMASTFGAIIGAAVLTILPQLLTSYEGLKDFEHALLGLIMMATMIFLRNGLLPSVLEQVRGRRS